MNLLDLNTLLFACCSCAVAIAWQKFGADLTEVLLFRKFDDRNAARVLAWISWPVVSGFFCLTSILLGMNHRWIFIAVSLVVCSVGVFKLKEGSWKSLSIAFFLLFLPSFCAAIPQTFYDQLNYHLLVSKSFSLRSVGTMLDPHLLMTGVFEFNLMLPRSWLANGPFNDIFLWSFGQVSVRIIFFGWVFLMLNFMTSTQKQKYLAYFMLACYFLNNLPESSVSKIFKPDFMLLIIAATYLFFQSSSVIERQKAQSFTLGLLLSLKLTAAFPFLVFSAFKVLLKDFKVSLKFLTIGLIPFGFILYKNYLWLRNPVYPSMQSFFASPFSDDASIAYWKTISQKHLATIFDGALGFWRLGLESPVFFAMTAVFVAYLVRVKKVTKSFLKICAMYVLLFLLIWPIFYWREIFPRFVLALFAPFILVHLKALSSLAIIPSRYVLGGMFFLFLMISGVDTQFKKIWQTCTKSISEYLTLNVETFAISQLVNSMHTNENIVFSDSPERYLFDASVIFVDPSSSVLERARTRQEFQYLESQIRPNINGSIVQKLPAALFTFRKESVSDLKMKSLGFVPKQQVQNWNVYVE